MAANKQASDQRPGPAGRWLLFLACLGLGVGIAVIGRHLTGDSAWFLALPLCLAMGWLWVADPEACLASRRPEAKAASPAPAPRNSGR